VGDLRPGVVRGLQMEGVGPLTGVYKGNRRVQSQRTMESDEGRRRTKASVFNNTPSADDKSVDVVGEAVSKDVMGHYIQLWRCTAISQALLSKPYRQRSWYHGESSGIITSVTADR
jgi:hypothetical protein